MLESQNNRAVHQIHYRHLKTECHDASDADYYYSRNDGYYRLDLPMKTALLMTKDKELVDDILRARFSYNVDEIVKMSSHENSIVRTEVAVNRRTPSDILRNLCADERAEIRHACALHKNTSYEDLLLLSCDTENEISNAAHQSLRNRKPLTSSRGALSGAS